MLLCCVVVWTSGLRGLVVRVVAMADARTTHDAAVAMKLRLLCSDETAMYGETIAREPGVERAEQTKNTVAEKIERGEHQQPLHARDNAEMNSDQAKQ